MNSLGRSAQIWGGVFGGNEIIGPNQGQKGTPKNLCEKDFAELSGELSGGICLKPRGPIEFKFCLAARIDSW